MAQVQGGVDEIDSDYTHDFLLFIELSIKEPQVNDEVMRRTVRSRLQADTHPPVAFLRSIAVSADTHGIGVGEELAFIPYFFIQSFDHEIVLMFQHVEQPLAGDVLAGGSVDGITDRHVISGDGFGDTP